MRNIVGSIVMFTLDRRIDRRILLEAESLQKDGWKVTIVAMPSEESEEHDPSSVVRIESGGSGQAAGDSFVLSCGRMAARKFPPNGRVMKVARALVWKFVRRPEAFYTRLFSEAVRQYKADVYVAHDLPMMPVAVAAAQYHEGAKLVYDSHEYFIEQEFTRAEKKVWAAIERKHIKSFDAVITVNASIAGELKKRYALSEVAVVHNSEMMPAKGKNVHLQLFHTCFTLPDDAIVLLFQGGLSKGRNIETLVSAMAHVHTSHLHLVILGDGAMGASLKRLARTLHVQEKVHLHPAVSQKQLLEYTASADVGVIPYQATCVNNFYGTPNKLFEFISAGLPVIATDLPEIKKIVQGNGIGVVGETDSPRKMATLIDQFCTDSQRLKKYQAAVHETRKKINWQCESQVVLKVYRGLFKS